MTPGAETAHVVGRVACRRMRAGRWLNVVLRRAFAVFRRPIRGISSVIRASQVAPLRLRAVECCFASVIRASQVAPLRLRAVECGFASVIRASQVAPLRLRVVECCFVAVIRASQVAPLRLWVVECCFASVIRVSQVAPLRLRAVDCCFAGGCWRRNEGLSEEGDGYEKRSRTDVAVSVWLLVVAEARLERTTSRL